MKYMENLDQAFTKAMGLFADNRFGEAIEHLSQIVRSDGDHRLARITRGSAYLRMEEAEKAIADFDHVIGRRGDDSRAYHLRGLARELSGDIEGAISDISRAITLNPEYGAAYQSRASLYTKMGKEELAMEDIEILTALTQINVESFANENNVWRSNHMRVEAGMETELAR